MTIDQIMLIVILLATLVGFAVNRWRYDIIAIASLVVCVLTGLVQPDNLFVGFGEPAVATVAAVLVIGHALRNSGLVDAIATRLVPWTKHRLAHIAVLTVSITLVSAFMNNVGALALMLPVALATASEHKRSPAMLLMPLAFGSLLGGMTTMIGTPPNIIVSSYRARVAGEPFALFDYTPAGIVIAVVGVAFITLVGWRLIPQARRGSNASVDLFATEKYLTEVRVDEDSDLLGLPLAEVEDLWEDTLDVVGLARGAGRGILYAPTHKLKTGDVVLLRGDPKDITRLVEEKNLELATKPKPTQKELSSGDLSLMEATVPSTSPVVGRDLAYLRRRSGNSMTVLALARQGQSVRRRLSRTPYAPGDVLLLQGKSDGLQDSIVNLGLLPLAGRGLRFGRPRRLLPAVAILVGAIVATGTGATPLLLALLLAILGYVLLGILPARELYSAIEWPVVVLLGAMIPVGMALESTGTTEILASWITGTVGGLPLPIILGILMAITMFLSDVINNAATAVIMAPIGMHVASQLQANADPFLMCVAVGASSAFLTPIGHQSNTIVMGPAGYRFTDYWRMGLPLEALIVVVGVPVILQVWPA
jgi:di/tricarboxylate transporter